MIFRPDIHFGLVSISSQTNQSGDMRAIELEPGLLRVGTAKNSLWPSPLNTRRLRVAVATMNVALESSVNRRRWSGLRLPSKLPERPPLP